MTRKIMQRLALSLVLFVALFSGSVFAVSAAATPMSIKAVDLMPGSMVRLQFTGLPANVPFAVMMGVGGKGAVGAPTVAHISSSDGGTVVAWVEILAELRSLTAIDVRIDNGAGLSASTSFNNVSAPVTQSTTAVSSVGMLPASSLRSMIVMAVEKGGIVQVALSGLPNDTSFVVSEGIAGTQGFGGYIVGNLDTTSINGSDTVSSFEIAYPLRDEKSIDLRLASADPGGIVYFVNFANVDKLAAGK